MNVQTYPKWSVPFRPPSPHPRTEDCAQIRMVKNGRACV